MKWKTKDADVFLKSGEYVDSLLIPLTPVSFTQEFKSSVTMAEYTELLSGEMERQLHGRLFLAPNFTYVKDEPAIERLASFIEHVTISGHFKHVFLMTSDVYWKEFEQRLSGKLFWVPALPLDSMDENYKLEVVKEQVKPLFQLIFNDWQRSINS